MDGYKTTCEPPREEKDRDMVHDKIETERHQRSKDPNRTALGRHSADQVWRTPICEHMSVDLHTNANDNADSRPMA
jgi:hypothetical protein